MCSNLLFLQDVDERTNIIYLLQPKKAPLSNTLLGVSEAPQQNLNPTMA